MLSEQTIKRIKDIYIIDLISGYLEVQKRGQHYVALCPFHNEKTPSFTLYTDSNRFHCHGCGASGNNIDFVMKYRDLNFYQACSEIAQQYHIDLKVVERRSNYVPRDVREQLWEEKIILTMARGNKELSLEDMQRARLAKARINKISKQYNLT